MRVLEQLLWSMLPSVLCGILLAWYKKQLDRRDQEQARKNEEAEERAKARKEESFLSLEMQMANAKLAYATAMALKRGHANGEVEEGISAYESTKTKYFEFLNRQAKDHLSI